MTAIQEIQKPIQNELTKFEPIFKESLKSKIPLLNIITNYILRNKGKQLRPMFVFLSAKMLGDTNASTYHAASLIELLHTATLIHDDVVDDANERRNAFSVNALWKSKIAILIGDYLLAKGLLLAVDNEEYNLLKIVSNAVKEMSEGELLQIKHSKLYYINEQQYFSIISKKTASLIASCMACGAESVKASKETVAKMHELGLLIGIAFQLKDDLFDYQSTKSVGKPFGNDIKERKITLPLIHALSQCSMPEQIIMIAWIKKNYKSTKEIHKIIEFAKDKGGVKYAEQKMSEYAAQAKAILNTFDDNESKTSLLALIDYVITRSK